MKVNRAVLLSVLFFFLHTTLSSEEIIEEEKNEVLGNYSVVWVGKVDENRHLHMEECQVVADEDIASQLVEALGEEFYDVEIGTFHPPTYVIIQDDKNDLFIGVQVRRVIAPRGSVILVNVDKINDTTFAMGSELPEKWKGVNADKKFHEFIDRVNKRGQEEKK